ncbi:MAG: GH3 auxin-responsive promoter family protein [Flavobacteriales bacterium AspAUS03]
MSIKSFVAKPLASIIQYKTVRWSMRPIETQNKVFRTLINTAKDTRFGVAHRLKEIQTYEEFKQAVPIRAYEAFKPYINRILAGEVDVLCKGKPFYLTKTSGTTSGIKYIPLTKGALTDHLTAARNALLQYIYEMDNDHFLAGKMIFLQGSPELSELKGIKTGRLSGIVAHHIPKYLQTNRMPSWTINCMEDWEKKIDAIVEETSQEDMRLISGIPPWVKMYFEKLKERSGKTVGELFPNFSLMVTGGVNYTPYQKVIQELIGRQIDIIQTYPASEGFIAYQDRQQEEGLLLLLDQGIFYEFIPWEEFFSPNPSRINIEKVLLGIDYVLIVNTNSGLWGYNIGDTIRFISKDPYRIIVTGRIKHFTSAFGEHVIAYEVETALEEALKKQTCTIVDFTVAPQVTPQSGLPHHEWYIEFKSLPKDLENFTQEIDQALRKKNTYYNDLISGNILRPLIIKRVRNGGMRKYMKSIGKLGGQYKLPRLSNDRKIANVLESHLESS